MDAMRDDRHLPLWECKECETCLRSDPIAQNWTSRYGGAWTGPACPRCKTEMQVVHEDEDDEESDDE